MKAEDDFMTMNRSSRLVKLLGTLALGMFTSVSMAHAHLKQSVPAEGATVTTAPTQIVLTFSEAAVVTALTIQQDGGAEQKLGPLPTEASKTVTVPSPGLKSGKYVVTWRAVSDDKHVVSGKLHFQVS
jgi:methionine-rich copper-binding protein CopC